MVTSRIESLIDSAFSENSFELLSGVRLHNGVNDHFADFDIIEYQKAGVAIYLDSERFVKSIFLYGEAEEGYVRYGGFMPRNLSFDMEQFAVEHLLGVPTLRGVHRTTNRPWVRYDNEGCLVHLEFSVDCSSIKKITLMSTSVVKKS